MSWRIKKVNSCSNREFLVGLITSRTNRRNMKYEIEISNFLISQIPMPMFEKIRHSFRLAELILETCYYNIFVRILRFARFADSPKVEDSNRHSRFDFFERRFESRFEIRFFSNIFRFEK